MFLALLRERGENIMAHEFWVLADAAVYLRNRVIALEERACEINEPVERRTGRYSPMATDLTAILQTLIRYLKKCHGTSATD